MKQPIIWHDVRDRKPTEYLPILMAVGMSKEPFVGWYEFDGIGRGHFYIEGSCSEVKRGEIYAWAAMPVPPRRSYFDKLRRLAALNKKSRSKNLTEKEVNEARCLELWKERISYDMD